MGAAQAHDVGFSPGGQGGRGGGQRPGGSTSTLPDLRGVLTTAAVCCLTLNMWPLGICKLRSRNSCGEQAPMHAVDLFFLLCMCACACVHVSVSRELLILVYSLEGVFSVVPCNHHESVCLFVCQQRVVES
jgi:hypothetical protein